MAYEFEVDVAHLRVPLFRVFRVGTSSYFAYQLVISLMLTISRGVALLPF